MLEVTKFALSKNFFEYDPYLFSSTEEECLWKRRVFCFSSLLGKILILPLALAYKGLKSFLRITGVFFGLSVLVLTIGVSANARRFFSKRMEVLGADIADWVLYPFAIFLCFLRLLLASTLVPRIYST